MRPDSKPREAGWRTRDIRRASAIVAGVYVRDVVGDEVSVPGEDTG